MQIPTSGDAGWGSISPRGDAGGGAQGGPAASGGAAQEGPTADAAAEAPGDSVAVPRGRWHTGAAERNIRASSSVEMSRPMTPSTHRECAASPVADARLGRRGSGGAPAIGVGEDEKSGERSEVGGAGSGELTRNVPSPALPNACETEARGALLSLAVKKRPIQPFPADHLFGCFEVRAIQERGPAQVPNTQKLHPAGMCRASMGNQTRPQSLLEFWPKCPIPF